MKLTRFTRLATAAAVIAMATTAGVALAPSAFAAPGPITVSPNSGLHDGDTVTVSGSGFATRTNVQIEECSGATQPSDLGSCDGITNNPNVNTDSSGAFTNNTVQVFELGVPGSIYPNSTIRCDATHACGLWAFTDPTNPTATGSYAAISFATYGNGPKLKNQSTPTAFPNGPAVTLNVLTGATANDSVGNTETIVTAGPYQTSAPSFGSVSVDSSGIAHYTPNASIPSGTTQDTFTVAGTATYNGSNITGPPVNQPPATITVPIGHGNPPTLQAQSVTLAHNANGQTGTISPLNGASAKDSAGNNETLISLNCNSGAAPLYGTISGPDASNNCTYTEGASAPANGATDTFQVTATYAVAGTSTPTFSANKTETVIIPQSYSSYCDVTSGQPSCPLYQVVIVPVTGADLTMAQNAGLPQDNLNATQGSGGLCNGPQLILNGQPQVACGLMAPITVVNARGTDASWTLSAQVSDFVDSRVAGGASNTPNAGPSITNWNKCDAAANYLNDCIPGGNLGISPAAAVSQGIAPGDVASVSPGAVIAKGAIINASALPSPLIGGCGSFPVGYSSAATNYSTGTCAGQGLTTNSAAINYPSNEPAPTGGLHTSAQPLCTAPSTHSGGTFVCGANLWLTVPASAHADPSYQAFLVLTLA